SAGPKTGIRHQALQVRNFLQVPKGVAFLQALLDVLHCLGTIPQIFVRFANGFQNVGIVGRKRECRLYARNGLFAKLFLGVEQPQIGLRNGVAGVVQNCLFEQGDFTVVRSALLFFVFEASVGNRQVAPYHVIPVVQLQGFLRRGGGFGVLLLLVVEISKVGVGGVAGLKGKRFPQHLLGFRVVFFSHVAVGPA